MLAMLINWDVVLLCFVVAFIVLCVLTSLILKELNKHLWTDYLPARL